MRSICPTATLAFALLLPLPASAEITVYERVGNPEDSTVTPQGPGLVLMGGGTDVDAAFVWMHRTITGGGDMGGDVVVLRATGENGYDEYILGLAAFNSVQTLLIPSPASSRDLKIAAAMVDRAEAVFFAGGNQEDYVRWKGELIDAVARVYERGGVVGGTSAGLAILGEFVYDSIAANAADEASVESSDATYDPYEPEISFTSDFFHFPPLAGTITDTHFANRDRFGRLAAFMARQIGDERVTSDPPRILGIGVDEMNAVVIDREGIGRLLQQEPGTGAAFLILGGQPDEISDQEALYYRDLLVTRLDDPTQLFDFNRWCGTGPTCEVTVDGQEYDFYNPLDPYTVDGEAGMCAAADDPWAAKPEAEASGSGSCRAASQAPVPGWTLILLMPAMLWFVRRFASWR